MIQVAAPVEHYLADARSPGALGDQLADGLSLFDLGGLAHRLVERGRCDKRIAAGIVDHLCINVVEAPENGEPRPLGRAAHPGPHPVMPLGPRCEDVWFCLHISPYFFPPTLPAFPALRRMRSPWKIMPLPR